MADLTPIFPLELVVYPGNALNLHIFEPRYKQLIRDCEETGLPFGIPTVLNRAVGEFGTLVELLEITNVQPTGEMDIRTRGLKIFRIERLAKLYPGKLYGGAWVKYPDNDPAGEPETMQELLSTVKRLHAILKVDKKYRTMEEGLTSYELAQHIGLALNQEYELLGIFDERTRQKYLLKHLERILPVVESMEELKQKIKLNGHFKNLPGLSTD
jgi:Lon protease-like protein